VFLSGVAIPAGRNNIAFRALAATGDRDNVIHSQGAGGEFVTAIMAQAGGAASLPPLARTQLPGFLALATDLLLADGYDERGWLHGFTCTNA